MIVGAYYLLVNIKKVVHYFQKEKMEIIICQIKDGINGHQIHKQIKKLNSLFSIYQSGILDLPKLTC
ncbi:MAG: hypothetical protein EBR82_43375 [Caulobacteraceae bacterium]|nr:hypothetical protein [Caulobacteraceae bacterium]